MLIKDLSKEIDTKDMTAVHGGSADAQIWVPTSNSIAQGNVNTIAGNMGQVQIDNNQSASESTSVRTPVNYGLELKLLSVVPELTRLFG
jgi:hypothetical protein